MQVNVDDWDAPPTPSGHVTAITGTALFAAISVMEGGPHSLSSMLEGLFYSILFICSAGRVPGERAFKISRDPEEWAIARRSSMTRPVQAVMMHQVSAEHAGLVAALHMLFFPAHERAFEYRDDVSVAEFCTACGPFLSSAATSSAET